jgi:hypothetical protein
MKKHDEMFTVDDDPMWDDIGVGKLDRKPRKTGKEKIVGPFYQVSVPWLDKAAEVCGPYLILAMRLYLRWRKRKPGSDTIAVSAAALSGTRHSKRGRQEVVRRLEEAGLIKVVKRGERRSPRVKIVDPQLQPY